MEGRLSLDELLRQTLGPNVHYYYQPPTGTEIHYPALVYKLDDMNRFHADNVVYKRHHVYFMLLILDDPDNDLVDRLDDLRYCHMSGKPYTSDNLYHYPFTIYY